MEEAVERGRKLVRDGARIVDIGGEASSFFRQGVMAVEGAEQWRRMGATVEELVKSGGWISVDTRSALVARSGGYWQGRVL